MQKRLLWTILILVVFGLVVLSSAGIVDGQKKFGDPYYYVKHQLLLGVLPGLVLMVLLMRVNYQFWKRLAFPGLFVALGLLVSVFIPSIGATLNGARSWIVVRGITFQPAELLKLALVLYLAAWFGGRIDRIKNWTYGAVPFLLVLAFVTLLLFLQPDLGTFVVVAAIAGGVYFIAGANLKHVGIIILLGLVAIAGLVVVAPYRINRIKSFLNPAIDPRGISYQLNQSLIAIGSGGVFGVGFGHSRQKFGFLPETVGDSIFAVIAEELGLVGALGTIGLFLTLCLMMVSVARQTSDKFGRLLVMGVAIWIMAQAGINLAAVTGVGPLTGIPLPFISYGGTALVSLLASLGIVLNVAKKV